MIDESFGHNFKERGIILTYLNFVYKNWKNKTGMRVVIPENMWYGSTEFHKEEQWFLKAFDIEKSADRDFAVKGIIKFL